MNACSGPIAQEHKRVMQGTAGLEKFHRRIEYLADTVDSRRDGGQVRGGLHQQPSRIALGHLCLRCLALVHRVLHDGVRSADQKTARALRPAPSRLCLATQPYSSYLPFPYPARNASIFLGATTDLPESFALSTWAFSLKRTNQ